MGRINKNNLLTSKRVWGVGCGVWGVGCGVWGSGEVGRINKNNLLTTDY